MKRVVVTGGSGFVGQLVRRHLSDAGYLVDNFDVLRGPVVDLLRRPPRSHRTSAVRLRSARGRIEQRLLRAHLIRPSGDDVLAMRARLTERFRGAWGVVHLAGIPHPFEPGSVPEDFRRINLDGTLNVFAAARDARVKSFVFASSGQVYGINSMPYVDQLPVLETNTVPALGEGANHYGLLKQEAEQRLAELVAAGPTQAISLRLEMPGVQSRTPDNLYVSTTIETLGGGVVAAIEAPDHVESLVVNLCDPWVALDVVDVQRFIAERFPDVPNRTIGNESLLSVDRLRDVLGFHPSRHGHYLDARLIR